MIYVVFMRFDEYAGGKTVMAGIIAGNRSAPGVSDCLINTERIKIRQKKMLFANP